jgi:hypothetical protein
MEASVRVLHTGLLTSVVVLGGGSMAAGASLGFTLVNFGDAKSPLFEFVNAAPEPTAAAGFMFEIYGDPNKPLMKFTNKSQSASITEFIVTIGDASHNFDYAQKQNEGTSSGMTWERVTPDANDSGGVRADQVQYGEFEGFTPLKSFTFKTDVDPDNSNQVRDYRKVMFNNGERPNSVVTANFSNGWSLSFLLPDAPMQERYAYTLTAIPVPPAVWGGLLLGGAMVVVRRSLRASGR